MHNNFIDEKEQEPCLEIEFRNNQSNLPSTSTGITGRDILLSQATFVLEDLDVNEDQASLTIEEFSPGLEVMNFEYKEEEDVAIMRFEFPDNFSCIENEVANVPLEIAEKKFDNRKEAEGASVRLGVVAQGRGRGQGRGVVAQGRGQGRGVKGRGQARGRGRPAIKVGVDEVLKIKAPRRLGERVVRAVPDAEKTPEYFAHRRRNTEAARKCREKKRALDEKRVEVIKAQQQKIVELQRELFRLQRENRSYQTIIDRIANGQQQQGMAQRNKVKAPTSQACQQKKRAPPKKVGAGRGR